MILVSDIEGYKLFHSDDGWVVHNGNIEGFKHTHIQNKNTALYLIKLSLLRKVPYDLPLYLLQSLLRINDETDYCCRIKAVLSKRENKKPYYRNVNKGRKK